jgi:hypothetical protein
MKRWLLGLSCMVMSGALLAAGPAAVRKRVQASMLVTGTIDVAPDGHVASYALDHPDKLPATVRDLLGKAIPGWTFEPVVVDGQPVTARSPMSVRVVAKPLDDGRYSIGVAGAVFGHGPDHSGRTLTAKDRVVPAYPPEALRARVAGEVYVLVRVDRQGKVAEALARQVNLRVIASDREMERWRGVLARASVNAIKHWTFTPPTVGKDAAAPYWQATIPVDFDLRGWGVSRAEGRLSYGQWRPYVPGPVQPAPWADKSLVAGAADAVPGDGIFQANPLLHLRTPLGGS